MMWRIRLVIERCTLLLEVCEGSCDVFCQFGIVKTIIDGGILKKIEVLLSAGVGDFVSRRR